MKHNREIAGIGAILVALSALLYFVHYLVFRDAHHIFLYLLGDLAFLPLEVFLVVVVIERVLASREKRSLIFKLNMLVGAFYSEVGAGLLGSLTRLFPGRSAISEHLGVKAKWTADDFNSARTFARSFKEVAQLDESALEALKSFLVGKRHFLLGLLENPNLMEHESFTDMLWALFHLTEELEARPSMKGLTPADLAHIAGDISRIYGHLTTQWLTYSEHLKAHYPYLFSLLVRTHPFQDNPTPTMQ